MLYKYWCTLPENDIQKVETCKRYSALIAKFLFFKIMHLLVFSWILTLLHVANYLMGCEVIYFYVYRYYTFGVICCLLLKLNINHTFATPFYSAFGSIRSLRNVGIIKQRDVTRRKQQHLCSAPYEPQI
jgi:hypothetical protein